MERTGGVAQEVNLKLESAAIQGERLKTSFENLAISIGGKLIDNFAGISGGAADLITSFRGVIESGGLDEFFNALKPQMQDFEDALKTIAKNLPEAFKGIDFSGLLTALGGLGEEAKKIFSSMFGDIDLTTVDGLKNAIQTIVNVITQMVNATKGIVQQFEVIFEAIGAAGKQVSGTSDETSIAIGKLLGAALMIKDFGIILTGVLFTIKESQTDIGNVFDALVGGSVIFINSIQVAFDGVMIVLFEAISNIYDMASRIVGFLSMDDMAADFKAQSEHFKEYADGAKENIVRNSLEMQDGWKQMSAGIKGSSNEAADSIGAVGKTAPELEPVWAAAGVLANSFIKLSETSASTKENIKALGSDGAEAIKNVTPSVENLTKAQTDANGKFVEGHQETLKLRDGLYTLTATQEGATVSVQKLGTAHKEAAVVATEGSKEWKNVQDVMIATQKVTDDFVIKMGELGNKRYEIQVKAAVDLKTAEIVADTARISAALTQTATVIGTLITGATDLWGLFSQKAGFSGGEELKLAAQTMEDRLDKELAIKQELTDAIVGKMRAEQFRLESGEPLISIDARELAPELELVFVKILKYTQIKATQQGLSLLVGLS